MCLFYLQVDFFAIEMLDGHLYLLLDMGSGTTKTKAVSKKVNDGEWHHVDFQRDGRSGIVSSPCFDASPDNQKAADNERDNAFYFERRSNKAI